MPEEKEGGIEEICLGHLSPGDNTEILKERLTVSYNLRKEKTETLQEFLDRMMPKDNIYARLTGSDFRILNANFGGTEEDVSLPSCGYCACDEKNKKCRFYLPVHMAAYSVFPKEEPKTE